MQADAPFRMSPDDFKLWSVRNKEGEMVPFAAFAQSRWGYGSPRLERYNGVSATADPGRGRAGRQHGRGDGRGRAPGRPAAGGVRRRVDRAVLPGAAGGCADAAAVRAVAAVRVPVPRGTVRELDHPDRGAAWSRRSASSAPRSRTRCAAIERDVYFQVAMLTTVGLTSKNAILIIAFATENLEARAWSWSRRRCRRCAIACARS